MPSIPMTTKEGVYLCSNCGLEAIVEAHEYEFKESGFNVILLGLRVAYCPECGNQDPIIPQMDDLMKTLGLDVAAKPTRLNGPEIQVPSKGVDKMIAQQMFLLVLVYVMASVVRHN